jgi:uncharacterized protein YndB with AHSA1/START domain
MDKGNNSESNRTKNRTSVERKSDRELVVTRTFHGPAHVVFSAWTRPELFQRWWAPKSFGALLLSCELDARTGGTYRLVYRHPATGEAMPFFGRYVEVIPPKRIVWTNDESEEPGAVTTVTFEESAGATVVVLHDLYPSKEALDEGIASGSAGGYPMQFEELDQLLVDLGASAGGRPE